VRAWSDGARLAVGTFSRLPVPAPRQVTRPVAGYAMVLAPVVGLGLALAAALVLLAGRWWLGGGVDPLLAAALAVATLAWLSGGLHLDGLADVADGLGSRRPPAQALEVMRRSDVGPMAVVALTVMLLVQVVALAAATGRGGGTEALVLAVVTGRVAIVVACSAGVPAARSDGLGAAVAASVPRVVTGAVLVALVALGWLLGSLDAEGSASRSVLAVLAGTVAGVVALVVCVRRFGGITGDVLGAVCEVATTATLVVLAGSPDLGGPDWAWLPISIHVNPATASA
jgi:adenosylcobinamide-GDP ribazoletransferase